jgi:hypothetical protein
MINRRHVLKGMGTLALGPTLLPLATLAQAAPPKLTLPPPGADGWISLINDRDLTGWYSMLQKSGKGVAEKKRIVTVENEMLHIMGADVDDTQYEAGYLATHQEFENVRPPGVQVGRQTVCAPHDQQARQRAAVRVGG